MTTMDGERLSQQLSADGWKVYLLPPGITDEEQFFIAVKASLPLNPCLVGNDNWDALSDSLWAGLHDLADDRIAIVLPLASDNAQHEWDFAVDVLREVAQSLGDPRATDGKPKTVAIHLVRRGGPS